MARAPLTFTYDVAVDAEPGNYSYVASSLQEVASHPLTVTAANGSDQASVSPAPTSLADRVGVMAG